MDVGDGARIGLIGLAGGLVAAGVLLVTPAAGQEFDPWTRQETQPIALDDHDDDDDADDDDTGDPGATSMDNSTANSHDATDSVVTSLTRDQDHSRDGLTRDLTDDGPGGPTRDWSDNRTDDASVGDTRASRATNDNTRSNYSGLTRDRDHSRGDLTRDQTRDGGDLTRDLTKDSTNDSSRNDTR